jgi:hypothetical protein
MVDIKFADGMNCRVPTEKAESLGLVSRVGFNVEKFYKWAKEHEDEKGWVNVGIWKSKKTFDHYASLDTWKPEKREEVQPEAVDPDAVIGF